MICRAWNLKPLDRQTAAGLAEAIAQEQADQLEMEASSMGEDWPEAKYRSVRTACQKEVGLLAGVLAARGITDPDEALILLAGEEPLSDPFLLKDIDKACARIQQAVEKGETIVIFGDYDVDGVTATALLY